MANSHPKDMEHREMEGDSALSYELEEIAKWMNGYLSPGGDEVDSHVSGPVPDALDRILAQILRLEDSQKEYLLHQIVGTKAIARMVAKSCAWSSSWSLRDSAAEALGICGDASDVDCLAVLLKDQMWVVRASAVSSIVSVAGETGIRQVARRYRIEPEAQVRKYIASALARGPARWSVQKLRQWQSTEKDDLAMVGIAYSLAVFGFGDGFEMLLSLAGSVEFYTTVSAMEALVGLKEKSLLDDNEVGNVVELLENLAANRTDGIKRNTEWYLDQIRAK